MGRFRSNCVIISPIKIPKKFGVLLFGGNEPRLKATVSKPVRERNIGQPAHAYETPEPVELITREPVATNLPPRLQGLTDGSREVRTQKPS